MKFKYKAFDKNNKTVRGTLDADSEKEAYSILKMKKYSPTSIQKIKDKTSKQSKGFSRLKGTNSISLDLTKQIPSKDMIFLFNNLYIMIKAGVSLPKALEVCSMQFKNVKTLKVLKTLVTDINNGRDLSESIEKSKAFPKIVAPVLRSGEESGTIEESFRYLSEFLKSRKGIKSKIITSLVYPVFIFLSMIVALYVISTKVLPNILQLVQEQQAELDFSTKALIWMSEFFGKYGPLPIILLFGLIGTGIYIFFKTNKNAFDRLLCKIPIMGLLIKRNSAIQFVSTLKVLISSGLPIVKSLEIVHGIIGNEYIKSNIESVKRDVIKGDNISDSLDESIFGPIVVNILRIGEESGNLEDSLESVISYLKEELDETTKRLTETIVPFSILVLSVLVGVILMGVMKPMLSVYQNYN
ncbi:type II secretion system F family protein (plasmid) [Rossellomorea sp. AcN35-11]|nr:type II secretion system F family protein [Rossellomorea aquimaris]WJV32312.1 type II secretion system F family protein [Rossellomorea sp. AcN35-11]